MEMTWKVADAKNRFSELINNALAGGPQIVERRGERVVVLSGEAYDKLTGETPSLKSLLIEGPSLEGIDLIRSKETMRELEL